MPGFGGLLLLGQSLAFRKEVFRRPQAGVDAGGEFSYPSGHTGRATTALLVACLVLGTWAPRWLVPVLASGAVVLAVVVVSRLISGEHYLTDIVGTLLGIVGLLALGAAALRLDPVSARVRAAAGRAGRSRTRLM